MPILSVEGMLDALPGAGHNSASVGTALLGSPYLIFANSAATFSEVTISKDVNGWLNTRTGPATGTTTQTTKYCGISRLLSDYTTIAASTYLYGGVRLKVFVNATQLPIVTLHDRKSLPNTPSNQVVIFNYQDIPGGVVAGQEYYFEWAIDMAAGKVYRRLDGNRIADVTLSAANITALLAQGFGICYGFAAGYSVAMSTVVGYSIKDIYVGEKVAGETVDWLGPRSVVPVDFNALDSQWLASAGTPLSALQTPINDSASLNAPSVTSDVAGTPGTFTMNTPAVTGIINAVTLTGLAKRQAGSLGGLKGAIKSGNNQIDGQPKNLDLTYTYVTLGLYPKAPGNVSWTKELLGSLSTIVTPSN